MIMKQINTSDAISLTTCRRRAWSDLHFVDRELPLQEFDRLIMESCKAHDELILHSVVEHIQATDADLIPA